MNPRLLTFGGLALDRPGATVALPPRRLALLAVLAAGGDSGTSRDKLLAYFWPERGTPEARHALAQALHALRREIGVADLLLGREQLRLNRAALPSDVAEFLAATKMGVLENAVSLYTGPFLDGVHVADAPDFERWAERERSRLAGIYQGALETLAGRAEDANDHSLAADWLRRALSSDPPNSRLALRLMRALVAAGDRANALVVAAEHEAILRDDLDVAPAPDFRAYVASLREPPQPGTKAPPQRVRTTAPPFQSPRERHVGHRRAWWGLLTGGLLLCAGAFWISGKSGRSGQGAVRTSERIAILPFTLEPDSQARLPGDGFAELLAMDFGNGVDGPGAVDPQALAAYVTRIADPSQSPPGTAVAKHFGAPSYITGTVVADHNELRITAALFRVGNPDDPVTSATVEGSQADVFGLVDHLAAQLLGARAPGPGGGIGQAAAITTTSLPALRAFLDGERAYREGRWGDALDAFERAVAADTGFALGYYRLSEAADWSSHPDLPMRAAQEALNHATRLPDHYQLLMRAMVAWRHNDWDEAERLYGLVTAHYPNDLEGWYQLGEVLFHDNPLRGRSAAEARGPFEHTLELDPDNLEATVHLTRIAGLEGRREALDTLLRRALALTPADQSLDLHAYHAFLLGSRSERDAILNQLRHASDQTVYNTAWRVSMYGGAFIDVERMVDVLTEPGRAAIDQAYGHTLHAWLELTQGRWHSARTHFTVGMRLAKGPVLPLYALAAIVPGSSVPDSEVRALRDSVAAWNPARERWVPAGPGLTGFDTSYAFQRLFVLGELAQRLGDRQGLARATASLDQQHGDAGSRRLAGNLARLLRAQEALSAGRPAEAWRILGDPTRDAPSWFAAYNIYRYVRGVVADSLSQTSDAYRWLGTYEEIAIQTLPYAAPAHVERGRVLAGMRAKKAAESEFSRTAELLAACDTEWAPIRRAAVGALDTLQGRGAALSALRP